MSRGPATLAAMATLALAGSAGAQGTVRTLSKPVAELEEPFTTVSAVRELSDGRLIVVDARDKLVQMVNLSSGATQPIGREGQGPGEYSLPTDLFAAPGDTTLLFDPLNQRVLLIAPSGKPAGEFSLRSEGSGPGPRLMGQPRYADARGRLYIAGSGFTVGPNGPQTADSVPVVRVDRASKRYDTLAYIHPPKNNASVSGGSGQVRMVVGMANPLAPRDEWAVTADGRLAIVTPDPYRVTWVSPGGAASAGPVVPVKKLKVTDADKQAIEERRKKATGVMITAERGAAGPERRSARQMSPANFPPLTDWPEYKPPFVQGAAVAAPGGALWVLRTAVSPDEAPSYDVFDGQGRLTGQVQLPKGTRLVGFGKGAVYLARSDADDLQYLQKYVL